jgi:hypothetical protein
MDAAGIALFASWAQVAAVITTGAVLSPPPQALNEPTNSALAMATQRLFFMKVWKFILVSFLCD